VNPGQTAWFSTAITGACSALGFNWNCSGGIQHEFGVNGCSAGTCTTTNCVGSGFAAASFPGCGVSGSYRTCTSSTFLFCSGGGLLLACGVAATSSVVDRCH
jgi:hypothetical protein